MFDLDKLEFAFGGRNTASLDITKYSERMRRRDQIRGACKDASGTITSTEMGFTPGGEPSLVLVSHPGASIRD